MAKTNAARIDDARDAIPRHLRLFKPDHPRAIDRYIDYFGSTAQHGPTSDPCGEAFLETLGADRRRAG